MSFMWWAEPNCKSKMQTMWFTHHNKDFWLGKVKENEKDSIYAAKKDDGMEGINIMLIDCIYAMFLWFPYFSQLIILMNIKLYVLIALFFPITVFLFSCLKLVAPSI